MTAKPTATIRAQWRTDKKLLLKEIVAIEEDGGPVTLKVLNITPDPAADADPERKLLDYARRVVVQAELVVIGKKRLAAISGFAALWCAAGTGARGVSGGYEQLRYAAGVVRFAICRENLCPFTFGGCWGGVFGLMQ
jgi:hypothetical protein